MNISKISKTTEDELILSQILNKQREFLIMHPEQKISAAQFRRFAARKKELQKGIPLSYILGYKWFYGNQFFVNKNVLIPRPETEELVDKALEYAQKNKPRLLIDVGCGSGAIAISVKKNFKGAVAAIDISPKALAVAKKNAKNILGTKNKIKFYKSDLLSKIKIPNNALVIANLPYLSKSQLKEKSIRHEPRLALYGGKKSHALIEKLLQQIAKQKPKKTCILLEINYNQASAIKKIVQKLFAHPKIEVYKDLSKIDRIVKIEAGL